MKTPDCNCSTEAIWRYVDRELSAREMARVSEQLRQCENCRSIYEAQGLLARSLTSSFVDSPFGESFVMRSKERFSSAGISRPAEPGIRTIEGGTKLFFRSKTFIRTAAALLLVSLILVAGYLFRSPLAQPLGGLRVTGRDEVSVRTVDVPGQASQVQPSPGYSVFEAGRIYDVPPGTSLSLLLGAGDGRRDGVARLEVSGPARFSTDPDCTVENFHGNLIRGVLRARVRHRQEGETFRVSAGGLHQARVIGTVFVLTTDEGSTSLAVEEGLVSFGTVGEDGEYLESSRVGPADEVVTLSTGGGGDAGSSEPVEAAPATVQKAPATDSPAPLKPGTTGIDPATGSTGKPPTGSEAVPGSLRDQLDRPANPQGE